jgi:BirA family biotin operon repressor/biotin-[acetyl-CoA-carboxylase] ligase
MSLEKDLEGILAPLALGAWQFHTSVDSTNDIALDWAKSGAPDWALVIADEQQSGRGRENRRWVTRPGSSLAFSLVLRPTPDEIEMLPRFTALGALGLIHALTGMGIKAVLKWPNDVLLAGKKAAGVLVEADWQEDELSGLVLGMGVNVLPGSVPSVDQVRYPATSVAQVLGEPVARWELLIAILKGMMSLRPCLTHASFIERWNNNLAFRNQVKSIYLPGGVKKDFEILGVTPEGTLEVRDFHGGQVEIVSGEISTG